MNLIFSPLRIIRPFVLLSTLLVAFGTGGASITYAQTTLSKRLPTYGLAIPKDQVTLRSAVNGHVQAIYCQEGQVVKQGEILVELDCGPARARQKIAKLEAESEGPLQNAKAELEYAQAHFQRMALLFKQKASSEREYHEAQLRLQNAEATLRIEEERMAANQARYELAAAELEQFFLRAPFDGMIVQIQTGTGASVSSSNDLVRLVSLDYYRVELFLPVVQANELEVDQMIPVQINGPMEQTLEARVVYCSPLIEAATGTTRVVLEIDNRELQLPAGLTVSLVAEESQPTTVVSVE